MLNVVSRKKRDTMLLITNLPVTADGVPSLPCL